MVIDKRGGEQMKKQELLGYVLGSAFFWIFIPLLMGRCGTRKPPTQGRKGIAVILAGLGMSLSAWSIRYMKKVGKGHPVDTLYYAPAGRTKQLMTTGPYKFCRNPMLLGVILYYLGAIVYLQTWWALTVFFIYLMVMSKQVRYEEERLQRDFGEAYKEYQGKVKRLIPKVW